MGYYSNALHARYHMLMPLDPAEVPPTAAVEAAMLTDLPGPVKTDVELDEEEAFLTTR